MYVIGYIEETLKLFREQLTAIRQSVPTWIFNYMIGVWLVLLLLVWWVPGNEFDTMSSYIARIKLEEFGPLRQTATLELQYIFPTFFDYLHAPFIKWGWFTTLPNFALFTAALFFIILKFPSAIAIRIIIGFALTPAIIVTVTGMKNDISLALLSLLAWFFIWHAKPTAAYFPGGLLALCALVGVKWHGFILAASFFPFLMYKAIVDRALNSRSLAICVLCLPLFWWFSSADIYLANLSNEGTLFPRPDYIAYQGIDIPRNVGGFIMNQVLETFELPIYFLDRNLGGVLWPHINAWSTRSWNYAGLPNSVLFTYGAPMLAVIAASGIALFRRDLPASVRSCAIVALIYLIACLAAFPYGSGFNRYFLPVYILGLIPFAYLTASIQSSASARLAISVIMVLITGHALLCNHEKRLIRVAYFDAPNKTVYKMQSIFAAFPDRDSLYFQVWGGHHDVFVYAQNNISPAHRVIIINNHLGGEVPFIYPHIRNRHPSNTFIFNKRSGQRPTDEQLDACDFAIVFHGQLESKRMECVYDKLGEAGHSVRVYRRRMNRSDK